MSTAKSPRLATLPSHSDQKQRRKDAGVVIAVCVFLALIVGIAFGRSIQHEFVNYDDDRYVYANPRVTAGLSLSGIQWAFTHIQVANWHPLTLISHMLDCQLYGLQPWGHHLTNILLHWAAAIFLFLALKKLTTPPSSQLSASNATWASAFAAALFAIHPLRVESVAWVAERKDVLSGVFFALTLLAYGNYARSKPRSVGKYLIVVVLFAFGLMCKPTLVTLPFVLLLLDYWPLQRMQSGKGKEQSGKGEEQSGESQEHIPRVVSTSQLRQSGSDLNASTSDRWSEVRGQTSAKRGQWSVVRGLVVEKIPLFVLSAASCVATVLAQREAFAAIRGLPLEARIGNTIVAYVAYLGQTIYPLHLAPLYPYPENGLNVVQVILDLLLLSMISIAILVWRKKYPFLVTGWFWFLGMLVPMIGLVQVGPQARADRYTYLPGIGLDIVATWGAIELVKRWRHNKIPLASFGALIIIALTTRSYFQTSFWQDGETLWKRTISVTSRNYIAHNNLANWLLQRGRLDEAMAESRSSLAIEPTLEEAHITFGNALLQEGNVDGAVVEYRIALQLRPDFAEVRTNLGNVLLQRGQVDEAIAHYEKALETNPDFAAVHSNLGNALLQKGRINDAVGHYEKALEINPEFAEVHNNLGNALLQRGQTNDAAAHYQKALALKPDYAEAEYNLGNVFLQRKQNDQAIAHYHKALDIKSDYADAQYNLAKACAAEGNYNDAITACRAAVKLRPDYTQAYNNLGCFLASIGNTDEAIEQFTAALRIDSNCVEAHYNFGRLLAQLGRRQEAVAHLTEVLRLKPDYADTQQQLSELGVKQ